MENHSPNAMTVEEPVQMAFRLSGRYAESLEAQNRSDRNRVTYWAVAVLAALLMLAILLFRR